MKKYLFFMVLFLVFSTPIIAKSQWAILTYMEPCEDLHNMALFNLSTAALSGPGDQARVYMLIHTHKNVSWLYKIEDHALVLCKKFELSSPVIGTILEAWRYILEQGTAKHYGMSFWGHGYGILKPHYDPNLDVWAVHTDGENMGSCWLKSPKTQIEHRSHKGILPNSYTKQSISNSDMTEIFEKLVSLLGQKVAFCGMDCCKGAMFEHAYQLEPYTDYLVASQECELADGWDYYALVKTLKEHPTITPRDLVKNIVAGYENYYSQESKAGAYTLSSFETSGALIIASLIDKLGEVVKSLSREQKEKIHKCISNARDNCISFCDAPTYVDVYNLGEEILDQLAKHNKDNAQNYKTIEYLLKEIMQTVISSTVAKAGGSKVDHAHGTSIYFPRYYIDESYISTKFAQESSWLSLLKWQLKK